VQAVDTCDFVFSSQKGYKPVDGCERGFDIKRTCLVIENGVKSFFKYNLQCRLLGY
jgi:hypothetical protein